MKIYLTIALLTLLPACFNYPSRKLTPEEYHFVDEAFARWEDAGLDPIGTKCWMGYDNIRIETAYTQDEMVYLTGYCGPGPETDSVFNCKWGRADSSIHFEQPTIVVWHTIDPKQSLLHEMVHYLQYCTGRGFNVYYPHDDHQVWCSEGCPGIWNP